MTSPIRITELPSLPSRPQDGNKGTFGRALIVAGSRGMSGAAILCGSAALRSGAGLVRIAVPASILNVVASGNPCYTLTPLCEDACGRFSNQAKEELIELAQDQDVVAIGPGIAPGADRAEIVAALVREADKPLVLDADALNVLSDRINCLKESAGPRILTPHPGEFARLLKTDVATIQSAREEHAAAFARDHQIVLLLKGRGTIVTDGDRVYVNATGNPGMATAGSGDVLTGIVAALVGQGMPAFEAAQLGAWLHGRAGDLARQDLGEHSMIAIDLLTYLPKAFQERTLAQRS